MSRLYKSREDAVIFGVLGGLGEHYNVDPVLLRVIVVALTFMTSGSLLVPYLILALVMPDEPRQDRKYRRERRREYERRRPRYERDQVGRKEAEDVTEDDWSDF